MSMFMPGSVFPSSENAASPASSQRTDRNRPATRARPAYHFLLAFAAALIVPVLLFAAALAWQYVSSERSRAFDGAFLSAREAAAAIDRELSKSRVALETLASSPSLATGDLRTFFENARQAGHTLGVTIALHRQGEPHQVFDTGLAWGTAPANDTAELLALEERALHARSPVIGDLLHGPAHPQASVAVMLPVLIDSQPTYFLSATVPVSNLVAAIGSVELPQDRTAVVIDRKGIIVVCSDKQDEFVGKPVPGEWTTRTASASGLWEGRNPQGEEVTAAYVRSRETGWAVAVAVPTYILNAPVWTAFWTLFSLGAALFAVALLVAYWAGSLLSHSIQSLRGAGFSFAHSHEVSRVATPVREINEVGDVLAEAASDAKRREAHLRSILATVPSAMVVIDKRGIILAFSSAAEQMFGYRSEDICGSNVSILMPEPDRSAHDSYIARYDATGERTIMGTRRTVTALRKNGNPFPVELHVGEAEVDGEKLYTGFMRDQTERLKIEQELLQTQKMEAIGKLTGGVAHDFNNLLTVIKGNLEILEPFVGEENHDLLRDSQEAADLAAQLTASLLAFGRRMPLNPKRLDIGHLINSTSDLLRRTLGETISVSTSIKNACPAIVDGPQLQNAILNLAINARDAMPAGGSLSIGVEEVELDDDYQAAYGDVATGRYVMIAMTDTGTGMSKEVQERAFEPFFTTKPQGSGTGLGLSSVYGFVKQSGGHIALYSEEGKGTTIRVYLPCAKEEKDGAARASEDRQPLPRGDGQVILAVEDDNLVRRVTVARLKALGYNVIEAASGPAALEILSERTDIALLFTDMIMPGGMTGADLANEAKALRPEVKILFTSGYAEPDLVREADSSHENWLKKPYTAFDLACRVHSILQ